MPRERRQKRKIKGLIISLKYFDLRINYCCILFITLLKIFKINSTTYIYQPSIKVFKNRCASFYTDFVSFKKKTKFPSV